MNGNIIVQADTNLYVNGKINLENCFFINNDGTNVYTVELYINGDYYIDAGVVISCNAAGVLNAESSKFWIKATGSATLDASYQQSAVLEVNLNINSDQNGVTYGAYRSNAGNIYLDNGLTFLFDERLIDILGLDEYEPKNITEVRP